MIGDIIMSQSKWDWPNIHYQWVAVGVIVATNFAQAYLFTPLSPKLTNVAHLEGRVMFKNVLDALKPSKA